MDDAGSSSGTAALDALRRGAAAERAPHLLVQVYKLPRPRQDAGSDEQAEDAERQAVSLAAHSFLKEHSAAYVWHTGEPPSIGGRGTLSSASTPILTLTLSTPALAPDTDEWYALHLVILFVNTVLQASAQHQAQYAIQAADADGDLLLIQGADELPEWIEPSNAQNRVWIVPHRTASTQAGVYPLATLHLITPDLAPLPAEDSTDSATHSALSTIEALELLSQDVSNGPQQAKSLASPALQAAAFQPMLDFVPSPPESKRPYSNIHRTLAYLPHERVAALLQQHPQLCAQAINALDQLSVDPLERRAIARMERFGPLLRREDAPASSDQQSPASSQTSRNTNALITPLTSTQQPVLASVPLTQALYALTIHLVFFPPKPHFSQPWRDAVAAYRIGQDEGHAQGDDDALRGQRNEFDDGDAKIVEIDEEAERRAELEAQRRRRALEEGRWRDVGAKLVCGLEVLYARAMARKWRRVARPAGGTSMSSDSVTDEQLEELRHTPQYTKFIASLTSYGYFTSASTGSPLVQGSREWYELEHRALEGLAERLARRRRRSAGDGSRAKGEEEDEGEEVDSFAGRYRLENIPSLIDSVVPAASTPTTSVAACSTGSTRRTQLAEADIVDPSTKTLEELLAMESSAEWLTALSQPGPAHEQGGGSASKPRDGDAEEDDALEKLQRLMQGTTVFVERGEGDYRGALFDDEQGDEENDVSMDDGSESDDDADEDDEEGKDADMDDADEDPSAELRAERSARRRAQSRLAAMDPAERARRMGELVGAVDAGSWGARAAAAAVSGSSSGSNNTASASAMRQSQQDRDNEEEDDPVKTSERMVERARAEVAKLRELEARDAAHSGAPVPARASLEEAQAQARRRRDDLASALDAASSRRAQGGAQQGSTASSPSIPTQATTSSTSTALVRTGPAPSAAQRRREQEQLREDAKLLSREKHDGVSSDEDSSDDEPMVDGQQQAGAGAGDGGGSDAPIDAIPRTMDGEEAEQRTERERRLKLHELRIMPALDEDEAERRKRRAAAGSDSSSHLDLNRVRHEYADEGGDDDEKDDGGGQGMSMPDGPGIGPDGSSQTEDEMANFLDFTRRELGIDEVLWERIREERRREGRYLPPSASASTSHTPASGARGGDASTKGRLQADKDGAASGSQTGSKTVRFEGFAKGFLNKKTSIGSALPSTSNTQPSALSERGQEPAPERKRSALWTATPDSDSEEEDPNPAHRHHATSRQVPQKNETAAEKNNKDEDDRFYEMMDRMDAELVREMRARAEARARTQAQSQSQAQSFDRDKGKGKGKGHDAASTSTATRMDLDAARGSHDEDEEEDSEDDDELDAQDAELLHKLVSAQGDALARYNSTHDGGAPCSAGGGAGGGGDDAALLANFLQSLAAQGGAPGPVSTLAGRLGVGRLPRSSAS